MNSKIVYVSKEKTDEIKSCILHNDDIFIAEIEGAKIKTEADYVQAMSSAFSFPHELPSMKIGWYNDYICDLIRLDMEYDLLRNRSNLPTPVTNEVPKEAAKEKLNSFVTEKPDAKIQIPTTEDILDTTDDFDDYANF